MYLEYKRIVGLFIGTVFILTQSLAWAANSKDVTVLKEVVVTAEEEKRDTLPAVEGAKIYSGKKTFVIDLEETPEIINNNYRQALQKTPGLLLSEESTPLLSLGYRGLEPHRAQFTQVLKDGIPIHADMFGYPEAYYTPPLQTIDHIDFINGGGALLYGPQPGGALNFVTKEPYEEGPLSLTLENSAGSYDLFSNYTGLSGTQGPLGYYGYFHHRQSQGFRDNNSQVDLYSGGTKFKIRQDEDTVWKVGLDAYQEEHGEPGGLTRADFDSDPKKTNRLNDHFELNRYAGSLSLEKEIDPDHLLELKTFGGYYERLSWRQRTSGSNFGLASSGANSSSNDIESQEFFTGGAEARFKKDYEGLGSDENTLTTGVLYYHVTSPRIDKRGTTPDATDGTVRKDADRQMNYVSVFAENLFKFGKLSVTPGVRLESIWQSVKENINLDKTTVPLDDDSSFDFVPLAGLGVAYELPASMEVYGNISQSYRPKIYTQAVPTGNGQVVNDDLEEGKSWQADIGLRGKPVDYFNWDASVFYMEFKDQIGTSGSTVENVGDARHQGIELAGEFDVIGWLDNLNQTDYGKKMGSVNLFANTMLLNAEFTKGPNKGKTPQYAPDFIFKSGIEYDHHDKAKIRLAGTFVDDHFANDTNTAQFLVPSYKVWDLTGEVKVYKDTVSLLGGINNVFDEQYFSRVRSDGIDPAAGRNYYAGVKMTW
jgi:Fe(3+) dicitrate transport protein